MELFLDPEARTPLTGQLYEQLRCGIAGGRLLPGDQLTPSRQLAAELGVSRHTVTTAYGRLTAEGYTLGHAGGATGWLGTAQDRAGRAANRTGSEGWESGKVAPSPQTGGPGAARSLGQRPAAAPGPWVATTLPPPACPSV